ncbi:serine/threonine protein kinase [Lentzea atacamensis]|uniref:non-specific serine/threonine protein kinase n=1 Tax=Lentzea atacamensis TaxID=531938 RepID=A0ABX9EMP0_9PSEU|nr:serine/threonine-protein kinase [Lentzea atacamensis]RAS71379.1 serine/threonine protein kinase [Lentzea atacamensis]
MSEPWDGDLTGAVIDNRFVVGSLLGSGGMAEVYRAYDRTTTSSVAIKVFTGPGLPDDELRMQREATMLSSLECPGIIPVYASGTVSRRPYFVMREITGGTLRQRMREPLPPRFVARVGGQVAAVLDHVHGLGVVHRDIKPSNILIDDEEKQAYLADFGLALAPEVTRVTTTGVLVGTAGYLAPEQVRGADVGPEADVYSLGLVLLECLTGRSEYPGGDAEAALARLARPPRIPIDLPLAWVSLLSAMTDMEPARRPTAAQCSRSLLAAYEASAGLPALLPDAAVSDPPSVVPRQRRGKRLAISGAAAAAVAAVAVAMANLGGVGEAPAADERPTPGSSTQVVTVGPSTVTVVQTPAAPGAPPQHGSSSAGSTAPSGVPTTSAAGEGSPVSSVVPTEKPSEDPARPSKPGNKPPKKSDTPRP